MIVKKIAIAVSLFFLVILASGYLFKDIIERWIFSANQSVGEIGLQQSDAVKDIAVVAENLQIPWDIAFLPSGELLITERPGRLVKIGVNQTVIPIAGVEHVGEGGLLGLALHPEFSTNNLIYLYLTTRTSAGLVNR